MIEIGVSWDNEPDVSVDSICKFIDWIVSNGYSQYGGQLLARSLSARDESIIASANPKELEGFVNRIGLDSFWLDLQYNARYMTESGNPKWDNGMADKLVEEVEYAATQAAHTQDPDWPAIDLYSGVCFKRRVDPFAEVGPLGWQFTVGGDGQVTDLEILEEQLVMNSPCFVEIRSAIESIFCAKTEMMIEFS